MELQVQEIYELLKGRYQIHQKIGEGGMGIVYKAHDTRLQRPVAIKILRKKYLTYEKEVHRFLREARAASALNHPNICTVFDVESSNFFACIIMEYINGQTLRLTLKRKGPLPLDEIVRISIPIINALSTAHAKGIIHRDIKPDNIMISDEGAVKVMDFGLAKLKYGEVEAIAAERTQIENVSQSVSFLTSLSSFLGTAAYMSPEQIQSQPVDERSDIFSLGIVLYEMLTGSHPFSGEDNWAIMKSITLDEPKSVQGIYKRNEIALHKIILKSLAKDKQDRYARIDKMGSDLVAVGDKSAYGKFQRLIFACVLALSVLIISVFATTIFKRQQSSRTVLSFFPVSLTSEKETCPAFSPDGNKIAYSAQVYDTTFGYICIKNLSTDVTRKILAGGLAPDWSPDGTRIVFGGFRLFLADSSGNFKHTLCPFGAEPKWSPDGHKIVFTKVMNNYALKSNEIYLFSFQDSSVQRISPDNGLEFSCPNWSPDNRWIVCVAGRGSNTELWLIDAKTGEAKVLTDYHAWLKNPVWHPLGKYIYYISNQNGTEDIWRLPVNLANGRVNAEPMQLTTGLRVMNMDISPNGRRIVFTRNDTKEQIWQFPIYRKDLIPKGKKFLMANLSGVVDMDISADSHRLIVESFVGGRRSLVLKSFIDSSETILYAENPAYSPNWSADGQWVAFDMGGGNDADIWRINIFSHQLEQVIKSPAADWLPTYSPDGRWLCFVSNRTGQFDLWLQNLQTQELKQLTNTPEKESRGVWSHNSRWIAFFNIAENQTDVTVDIIDLNGNLKDRLNSDFYAFRDILSKLIWKSDDSALYFLPENLHANLYETSLVDRKTRLVLSSAKIGAILRGNAFAIKDGIGYFSAGDDIFDIYIAEETTAASKI